MPPALSRARVAARRRRYILKRWRRRRAYYLTIFTSNMVGLMCGLLQGARTDGANLSLLNVVNAALPGSGGRGHERLPLGRLGRHAVDALPRGEVAAPAPAA